MLDYSPTKTQKLLGNPDKSANPTASSPAGAGLAGEHCTSMFVLISPPVLRIQGFEISKKKSTHPPNLGEILHRLYCPGKTLDSHLKQTF